MKDRIDKRIKEIYGNAVSLSSMRPVGGGDINEAYVLTLSDGIRLFLKCNPRMDVSFFEAEKDGLYAIARTGKIGVPQVIEAGSVGGRSYLLMEFAAGDKPNPGFWERFGHELAGMHSFDASEFVPGGRFGFWRDNYIGAGDQKNNPCDRWTQFFRECRLRPQYEAAKGYFSPEMTEKFERLFDALDSLLTEPEKPALLHGDLWAGNYITGRDGWAWLIDPAVYVGHPEADIAMTELFGGYTRTFYDAYRESGLIGEGYERRRDVYNLYHMLNHLNLFGGGYLSSVAGILRRIGV